MKYGFLFFFFFPQIAEDEKILQQHSETVAQLTLEIVDLSQALQENIDQVCTEQPLANAPFFKLCFMHL